MFNIDEIDIDFNDKTFAILNAKFGSAQNESKEKKGKLSFGAFSSQVDNESLSTKKRCFGDHLSSQKYSEIKHLNEYNHKCSINVGYDMNIPADVSSYSPIISQKNIGVNSLGCLSDISNEISPLRIKSQIQINEISNSKELNESNSFPSGKKSFTFKSINKSKLPNDFPSSSSKFPNPNPFPVINKPEVSLSKGLNSFINLDQHDNNASFSYSPITSTQKNQGPNKLECLFNENISPIKIKPGICSELRKPTTSFPQSRIIQLDKSKSRKFPGPAGCLPKVDNIENLSTIKELKEIRLNNERVDSTNNKSYVANSMNNFPSSSQFVESGSWKRAIELIGHICWPFFQKYNVENIMKMVMQPGGGLSNSKIPVICLALAEIEYLPMDAAAKMSDKSGSIKCAIHRSVLETYKEKIKTGAIFILKKVSMFSPSGKKYYLNIIQSNIITIITPDNNDDDVIISNDNQSIITKNEIDHYIKQCSEMPRIVFDPKTAYDEMKLQIPSGSSNKQESSTSETKTPKPPENEKIDFFDDGMDEMLLSVMEESFTD